MEILYSACRGDQQEENLSNSNQRLTLSLTKDLHTLKTFYSTKM